VSNSSSEPTNPLAKSQLQLSEVIGAFSYALDLTEGQAPGHCIRCCWIGYFIGQQLGLSTDQLWELYYTILLKDAGCSSNAARLCELYSYDDRITKHDFKTIDSDNLAQLLQFVLTHTGVKSGMAIRFSRILNLAKNGKQLTTELITTRCERGAEIALQLRFSDAVAQGIRALDEHWDGNGKPEGLVKKEISIYAQIALLAQVVDIFNQTGGRSSALREVQRRKETWFDPELVMILESFEANSTFWTELQSPNIEDRVLELEPESRSLIVDDDLLDEIAIAFGQVVDAKSPFTAGHSSRVARYTDIIAQKMRIKVERRRWLRRGALLHDLGKLGVSNSILDKNGSLTDQEWHEVRKHPQYTVDILSRISVFNELAIVSGAHHERLDGKGYPNQLTANDITLETRIITLCDIFDAITADRPYRGPIPVVKAMEIMSKMVGTALDADCYAALKDCVATMQLRF